MASKLLVAVAILIGVAMFISATILTSPFVLESQLKTTSTPSDTDRGEELKSTPSSSEGGKIFEGAHWGGHSSAPDYFKSYNQLLQPPEPDQPQVCQLGFANQQTSHNYGSDQYEAAVSTYAQHYDLNPNLIYGIIAQESMFDPNAVSWVPALGLMQITEVAELELLSEDYSRILVDEPGFDPNDWPQYPGINGMTREQIIAALDDGTINGTNEWRFNPEKNIHGGSAYFRHVVDFFIENEDTLDQHISNYDESELIRLSLAGYNAGHFGVLNAVEEHGDDWFSYIPEEAQNYVPKVLGYCEEFST